MTTPNKFNVTSANYAHYLGENDAGEIIWVRSIYRAKVFTQAEFDQALEDFPWLREGEFLYLRAT
jgi:hypothetical protein